MKQLIFFLLMTITATLAHAQSDKVNKIIVGFPPGQATDQVARLLAQELSQELKENFIVENRPGQGGSVALATLARSEPDGNTMVLAALASLVVNPHLYKNVGYATLSDFEPVALVADLPMLLVVNPKLPVQSYKELVTYAKEHPGQLNYASSGNGTLSHLGMEELKRNTGMQIAHIPYSGSARSVADVVGGGVQMVIDTVAVTQTQIRAGKLRLLATTYSERLPAFPDTPTIAEQGVKDFRLSAWLGLMMPQGTPPDRVARINKAAMKAIQSESVRNKYAALGAVPRTMPTQAFRQFIAAEYERWGNGVRQAALTVD
ncbi:Bug family tripartite tricarboxylate transporter substrate binding protein [Advenella kashmirensis]|uniref:Bug family tripartite tricarboxylate transporter substrate binding protein n=1 Tax=Advenella kashmirensis TaxID=310575 RepID=UPI000422F525|nr:tripartite tricarboxylate transporter substrate binding protein [Advenella kashmirensis]